VLLLSKNGNSDAKHAPQLRGVRRSSSEINAPACYWRQGSDKSAGSRASSPVLRKYGAQQETAVVKAILRVG
jgi:hypothetical protein